MENDPGSKRDQEFDWLFTGQNPTNSFSPSSVPVNGGRSFYTGSSSSMRPVNHDDGFLLDHGIRSYHEKQHQQLPVNVNPVRSMFNHLERYPMLPEMIEYNPYEYDHCNDSDVLYCAGDFIPGFPSYGYRSPLSAVPDTQYDRNLEMEFSRLNMTSPTHHQILPPYVPSMSSIPASNIRNDFLYTQLRGPPALPNNGCNESCCSPYRREYNLLVENSLRSRDWISNKQSQNPSNSHLPRQQENRRFRVPASLKEMRGAIYQSAKDKDWCQFLQNKCEERKADEIDMIFSEIKDHIREVMVDSTMNYLAQKLFVVVNEPQLTHIVLSVISDCGTLSSICLNPHGTRAMQKLIEVLTTAEQRSLIVSALRRITVTLTKNTNGHHVVQNVLKLFSLKECQPIIDVIAGNCFDIATDKSGCCVLQHCVSFAVGETKKSLLTPIIGNSLQLSEHPYGNYVVQHVIAMQMPDVTGAILERLSGNFVNLGMNKFGSNVVEKFLKEASEEVVMAINREVINSHNLISLSTNQYGNYVAQKIINTAQGDILKTIINKILKEQATLNSHPYGKRVLALAKSATARLAGHHP